MPTIKASIIDSALANISDVPSVRVEEGVPTITFSGNYESPVNDLVEFLLHLQRLINSEFNGPSFQADFLMEAVQNGLYWDDNHYGGHATLTLNGVTLEGTSKYEDQDEDEEY